MSDVGGLVVWLRGVLAEDERVARGAGEGSGHESWCVGPPKRCECCNAVQTRRGFEVITTDDRLAEHIARHDPGAVLADIAAKRRILDGYQRLIDYYAPSPMAHPAELDVMRIVVRNLASAYADRPGFRGEWRL